MSASDRLERNLAVWFADTATPSVPDYTDEVIRRATRTRQRPRWMFVVPWRWPARLALPATARGTRVAWSTVVLLLVTLALLLAAAAFVGTRARLPAPFGPAGNGLLAFGRGGDIVTFDPISGRQRTIVTGGELDHHPQWSLDGRRLAFTRETAGGTHVAFVDPEGRNLVTSTDPLLDLDTDSIAWAPDGGSVAVGAHVGAGRAIVIVDAWNGRIQRLSVDYISLEVFWRPAADRHLLYMGRSGANAGLWVVSVDDGSRHRLPASGTDPSILRPLGWTWDGRRVAYQGATAAAPLQVHILDIDTGAERSLDVSHGHLSNDGTRVVGFDRHTDEGRLCVVSIEGGACDPVGNGSHVPAYEESAALRWSPDDEWIATYSETRGLVWLLDPDGIRPDVAVPADGPSSWQRTLR